MIMELKIVFMIVLIFLKQLEKNINFQILIILKLIFSIIFIYQKKLQKKLILPG